MRAVDTRGEVRSRGLRETSPLPRPAPGRDAEGGAKKPTERLYRIEQREAEAIVRVSDPADEACWRAFRAAVLKACEGPQGKTRAVVAKSLDVAEKTLEHWMNPGEPDRAPKMGVLLRLLSRRDILPQVARIELANSIVGCGGMVVMAVCDTDLDQSPAARQMLEIAAAHGRAAEKLHAALERASERGEELSKDEAKGLCGLTRELLRETAELVYGLEEMARSQMAKGPHGHMKAANRRGVPLRVPGTKPADS